MNSLLQEIKNAFDYLDYKENWDEDGAKSVNEKAFVNAIDFLLYFIKENINIVTPEINTCANGTIDISFRNEKNKARLLINFKENYYSFYGDVNGEYKIKESTENAYGHGYARVMTILNNWIFTHLMK